MKIYFDNVDFTATHNGPNCFAYRLALALGNRGHTLSDADDYDVALVFIEPSAKLRTDRPFVQRLDGIWMKPEQHENGMNESIRRAHARAACVVYQSNFDRSMGEKWLGKSRDNLVIRNGIEIQPAELRSETLIEMQEKFDKVFVCSANWHPQKRLRDNVELFRRLRTSQHTNSCLVVMGNNPDYQIADKGIFYTGSIRHDLCLELYSVADWMIHLAWLDHCPNTVVEAISQGCPVICSSEGGTKELIGTHNGIVVDDAEPFDFSLINYDSPPRFPSSTTPVLPSDTRAEPSSVDIATIARQYEAALQSVL